MAFNPRTITKELDLANLTRHNDNYADIKTELDAHESSINAHIAEQTAHGSTAAATPGAIMQRDSAGRAKVAAPAAADDIARKAEVDAVQEALDDHIDDAYVHLSEADRDKLDGIEAGAQPNQNAFAQVNNVVAASESDTLTIVGGTGIAVTTNPTTKTVTLTATGDATPGPHGPSHDPDGSDPIPALSALIDAFDALTAADIGAETPAGAQAKVDALAGVGNTKTVKQLDDEVTAHLADFAAHEADYVRQPAFASTSGTSTAYIVTLDPAPTSISVGFGITIVPHVDCGASPTLNINGFGAKVLKDQKGVAFTAGKLTAGKPYTFRLVGTDFLADSGSGGGGDINGQIEKTLSYGESISAQDPIYTQVNLRTFQSKLPNPATLPSNYCSDVTYSKDGVYAAVAQGVSPFVSIYKRSSNTYTKLANPSVLPTGAATQVAFSPDGTYLAVAHESSPYLTIYKRNGDTFTKLADPAVLPTLHGQGVAFSPDGVHLAHQQQNSPYVNIYKRSGDVFTRLDLSLGQTGSGGKICFSHNGDYLVTTQSNTPYITIYKRSGDTFTKLPNPSVLPTGGCTSATFNSDDSILAVTHFTDPFMTLYKRAGDSFIKLANPDSMPTAACYSVAFSPDNNGLVVGTSLTPYLIAYQQIGDKFVKQTGPGGLSTGTVYGAAFSTDGSNLMIAHLNSPFITIFPVVISAFKSKSARDWLSAFEIGYALDTGVSGDLKNVIITHH